MSLGDYYRRGASLRVGDLGPVITPGQFRGDLEATRTYIDGLARDVAAGTSNPRMTDAWRSGWTDFMTRWGTFYREYEGQWNAWLASSFPNLTGSWSAVIRFGEEARQWAQSFRDLGGARTALPESVPRRPDPLLPELNPLRAGASPFVWAILGVVGVVAFAYVRSSK